GASSNPGTPARSVSRDRRKAARRTKRKGARTASRALKSLEEICGLRFPNLPIPRFPHALTDDLRDRSAVVIDPPPRPRLGQVGGEELVPALVEQLVPERVLLLRELVGDDVLALN